MFVRTAVLLAVVVVAVSAARPKWHQLDGYTFEQYLVDFGKNYSCPVQRALRMDLFNANLAAAKAHNALNLSWKEGVNQFSDMTEAEFRVRLGYKKDLARGVAPGAYGNAPEFKSVANVQDLPTDVDWRQKGALTPVKDQGDCGSCYAFASTETLESISYLKTGLLIDLSEQQSASCTSNPNECGGTGGCEGGIAELVFQSAVAAGGLASEFTYPYTSWAGVDSPCLFNKSTTPPAATIAGYVKLTSNNATDLLQAVATIGPIAVSVDASSWSRYESGVFNGCNQTNPDIDHAVQLIGYGVDPTLGDYWTIRNSWTAAWGEEGFIRLLRGDPANPVCGTDTSPSDGTGCNNGPPSVTVCGTCGVLYDSCYPTV